MSDGEDAIVLISAMCAGSVGSSDKGMIWTPLSRSAFASLATVTRSSCDALSVMRRTTESFILERPNAERILVRT